jgi:hypothetical protein
LLEIQPFSAACEGHGAGRQAQSTAYLCSAAETMDRRMLLRMAGKVPPATEALRTKTEYQPANDPLGFPQAIAQKIVNRLEAAA